MEFRRIPPEELESFWRLRLQALQEFPASFGASYEESSKLTMEQVKEKFRWNDENFVIGAYNEAEELVGMAAFSRQTPLKLRHKGHIWSVYMSPGEQGQGNGRRLLQALIDELRIMEGLEQVLLTVVSANIPAVKLYEKLGFVRYGTEPRALLVDGDYVDEALMALRMG